MAKGRPSSRSLSAAAFTRSWLTWLSAGPLMMPNERWPAAASRSTSARSPARLSQQTLETAAPSPSRL